MKKLLVALFVLSSPSWAGLITHNDYNAGDTITAAKQNSNENAIFNEFNGNINSANISAGGVATTNIANGAVTTAKLDSVLQSSITVFNLYPSYRRPVLVFQTITTVDIENNSATANETCVIFPDASRRCVTEDTSSANKYRRFDITAAASFISGTEDSGLVGATEATNTWYALYAVKSQINSANFVIAGSTRTPSQANNSTLNAMFGTNGWVYLGLIRNGDNAGATGDILSFEQVGNFTKFKNACTTTGTTAILSGTLLATSAGATTLTYTFAAGTGTTSIPPTVKIATLGAATGTGSGIWRLEDAAARYWTLPENASGVMAMTTVAHITTGFSVVSSASSTKDLLLTGFWDNALGSFATPQ